MISINTHSSIRIAGEKILYFDPYEVGAKPFDGERPHDADIIFITHKHYDHFDPESIRALMNPSTILVAPESIRDEVLGAGFEKFHGETEGRDDFCSGGGDDFRTGGGDDFCSGGEEGFEDWCEFLAPGEEAEIDGVKVRAVPSYNTNKPNHLKEFGWLGYVVEMKDAQVDNASSGGSGDGATAGGDVQSTRYYVAGDTDDNEDIRYVSCDVALVPVGGTYTMDVEEAAAFASIIKPKVAVPTHYGSIVGSIECGKKFAQALNRLDSKIEVRVLM